MVEALATQEGHHTMAGATILHTMAARMAMATEEEACHHGASLVLSWAVFAVAGYVLLRQDTNTSNKGQEWVWEQEQEACPLGTDTTN